MHIQILRCLGTALSLYDNFIICNGKMRVPGGFQDVFESRQTLPNESAVRFFLLLAYYEAMDNLADFVSPIGSN